MKKEIFRKFSNDEHAVWKELCSRRFRGLEGLASELHHKGWKLLSMNTEQIPDFHEINKKLKKLTGWRIAKANAQYEDDSIWIGSMAKKVINITDYIREKKDLDYTPLPDIFHDAFGHLPFLAIPAYAQMAQKFGIAYLQAKTASDRLKIANIWWYGVEFSFVRENGALKALGTGLISSEGELRNALSDKVKKLPFDKELVAGTERSAHVFHKTLFILDNLQQLENVVDTFL